MPSVKKLKKEVKSIANDLRNECITYRYFHPEVPDEKLVTVLQKIDQKQGEIIYDINHLKYAGEIKPQDYFNHIAEKVRNEFISIPEELNDTK